MSSLVLIVVRPVDEPAAIAVATRFHDRTREALSVGLPMALSEMPARASTLGDCLEELLGFGSPLHAATHIASGSGIRTSTHTPSCISRVEPPGTRSSRTVSRPGGR
jgi:hypothetical protein